MANASLDLIRTRLNGVEPYHPFDAETFADWSVEAGDIVTVKRGEEEYASPVQSSRMVWKGSPQVTLSSGGSKERKAISKVSRQKYGRGSGAVRNGQELAGKAKIVTGMTLPEGEYKDGDMWIQGNLISTWDEADMLPWVDDQTDYDWSQMRGTKTWIKKSGTWEIAQNETLDEVKPDFYKNEISVGMMAAKVQTIEGQVYANAARLDVRADQITADVYEQVHGLESHITQTAKMVRSEVIDKENGLYSTITQTASNIRQEVVSTKDDLKSSIDIQADRIGLVVEGTGANAHIRPAQIVASINAQTGTSTVYIGADKIKLDGYVMATYLTTDWVTTKLASATNVSVKRLTLTNNGYIVLPTADGNITITGANATGIIRNLRVSQSGNTYKLQAITYGDSSWHDLPNSSFSRAVTSMSSSWGNGQVVITAHPQEQSSTFNIPAPTETCTSPAAYNFYITADCGGKTKRYLLKVTSSGGIDSFGVG